MKAEIYTGMMRPNSIPADGTTALLHPQSRQDTWHSALEDGPVRDASLQSLVCVVSQTKSRSFTIVLVLAEIKMIVLTLIAMSMPEMEGGKYTVVDPLNVTSVPPVGRLILRSWTEFGKGRQEE